MKKWLSFRKARAMVRKMSIVSIRDWRKKYFVYRFKNHNIPFCPHATYANSGWKNWMDWLNTNNIQGALRKYRVNDDFFKTWSSDMSYVLGMWWSDGNICGPIFSISQHGKRKYILEKILNIMDSNYKIKKLKGSNCYVFAIRSRKIVADIKKLGGEERKSLRCIFPKIPKKYLPDFIRGCWDGDGCISYHKGSGGYVSVLSSGSKAFIYSALKHLPFFRQKAHEARLLRASLVVG